VPWLDGTCVTRATNRVQATSRTPAIRREATAWPALSARSAMLATPAPNVIGISEAARVSTTTSSTPQSKNRYVNESGVVQRADGS